MSQNVNANLTADHLAVQAVGNVSMAEGNHVGDLAANVTGSGSTFNFTNSSTNLTIGTDDGVSGITTNNGVITVTTNSGNLTVSQNVATQGAAGVNLTAGGTDELLTNTANITGGTANLTADNMALGGHINVGTGASNIVTLHQHGRPGGRHQPGRATPTARWASTTPSCAPSPRASSASAALARGTSPSRPTSA